MNENSLQLDIPLLLPDIEESCNDCMTRLEDSLRVHRGILHVHVKRELEPAQLCLHYDPNLVTLTAVRRLAQQAGSDISQRFRHETIQITGMDVADAAAPLAQSLLELPGMLHANVNYAAGLAFVAYDSLALKRDVIKAAIRQFGYTPVSLPAPTLGPAISARPVSLVAKFWAHRSYILTLLAGLFLAFGWLGETFLLLPAGITLAFYLLAYLAGAYDIATHAIPGLFRGQFDTDILMLAAAAGAAVLGAWAEGAFLLFLFGLGHAGEHYALSRARHAVTALGELMPQTALVRRGDSFVEEGVEGLAIGDIVMVRPGDRVPVDGQIVRGRGSIDQAAITGESLPVTRSKGDELYAGSINLDNALELSVSRLAHDNTLARVMQMVAEAQAQQSPSQRLAQRFTAKFVPAVLVLVVLVTFVPPLLGWSTLPESFYRAMLLLVAASPCALAIGTPAAVLAGIAQAARNGVLIKGGVHLENLGAIRAMAFDKTGTFTEGRFRLTDLVALDGVGEEEVLCLAAAAEQHSNHPLAQAVLLAARDRRLVLPPASEMANTAGKGLCCQVNGDTVLVGSLDFLHENNGRSLDQGIFRTVAAFEAAGKSTMVVSRAGHFLGILALSDLPRPGVKHTLRRLRDLGIEKLVMLTGDNATVAAQIGRDIGVTDVHANLLPADKLEAVRALNQEYGAIAMTGDGVNDAPALAAATVGIAMGGAGTGVALETADVALMADDLGKLPFAVGLSRASRAIIRQNLAIALGVILLLILVSVLGWIQLSAAVVLHEGSTILVVLNALRLLRYTA